MLTFFYHDYVILEGVGDFAVPGILCARNELEIEERLDERVFAFSGRISNRLLEFGGIPVINALKEIIKLCDLIEAKVPEYVPGGKDFD